MRLVREGTVAEDLTQSTFVRLFEERATLRAPAKVRSWLWATAHKLAMNQLTRSRRSQPIDQQLDRAASGGGPEESAFAKDAAGLVWLAEASLEPRQYAVLDLTVRRDLSTQEVAETLKVPVAHAAVLVHRAREALGNAVRYLLVARRREVRNHLAALVPAGVLALTAEQRSSVDHHMRRCERVTAGLCPARGATIIVMRLSERRGTRRQPRRAAAHSQTQRRQVRGLSLLDMPFQCALPTDEVHPQTGDNTVSSAATFTATDLLKFRTRAHTLPCLGDEH
jgi:RNA polymerase sigma factor (sigma-70 family)